MGIRKTNPHYSGFRVNLSGSVVTAATGAAILNKLSTYPVVAYSLRQLNILYGGYCIKVRRSSDNATLDIGFVGGFLDTVALLTFCGSNSAYVVTWYDQSGKGNNVTQATTGAQPQIVNAGTFSYTINSIPAIHIIAGTYLNNTSPTSIAGITNSTLNAVWAYQVLDGSVDLPFSISAGGTNGALRSLFRAAGASSLGYCTWNNDLASTSVVLNTTPMVVTGVQSGGSITLVKNGTSYSYSIGVPVTAVAGVCIGTENYAPSACYSDYYASELIAYGSALGTTDRQMLEHDQESYYSIAGI